MIDDFFNIIKTAFILVAVAIVIIIIIVAIVKGKEHYEYKERKRKDKQEMLDGISRIKKASKHWNRERKLNYMDYLAEEYNKLEKAYNKPFGEGWACETIIMTSINGNMEYFSADLEALYDLYHYIDVTLDD